MSIEQQDKSRVIRTKIWRSVRSALGIMAGLAAGLAVFFVIFVAVQNADKEAVSLIAQYEGTQGAAADYGPNDYFNYYHISKDGVIHTCKVSLEDLRQFKPIPCENGVVITKK